MTSGRSPRMRGSRPGVGAAAPGRGSIPADAGEPCSRRRRARFIRVDPRGCGGATPPWATRAFVKGRSPRMRGSPVLAAVKNLFLGSIPADAGEPPLAGCEAPGRRVDPRGCGGALARPGLDRSRWGRSPRMRGSHQRERRPLRFRGSIPADAGEPRSPHHRGCVRRVDPRGCGGALVAGLAERLVEGRSPRMRGSPRAPGGRAAAQGSIPADAGEPRGRRRDSGRAAVDPRGCGGAW